MSRRISSVFTLVAVEMQCSVYEQVEVLLLEQLRDPPDRFFGEIAVRRNVICLTPLCRMNWRQLSANSDRKRARRGARRIATGGAYDRTTPLPSLLHRPRRGAATVTAEVEALLAPRRRSQCASVDVGTLAL